MSPELKKKLFDSYPELFEDRKLGFDKTRIQHIEVDDGWYDLVNAMCAELQLRTPYARFFQIKEKFGELRVYLRTAAPPESLDGHATDPAKIIDKYEFESRTICEVCGKKGKIQTIKSWVLKAVCEEHKNSLESA